MSTALESITRAQFAWGLLITLILLLVFTSLWIATRKRASQLEARLQAMSEQTDEQRLEYQSRHDQAQAEQARLRETQARLTATLESERQSHSEKIKELQAVREELKTTFQSLASRALDSNSQNFLKLAQSQFTNQEQRNKAELEQQKQAVQNLVKPIGDSLKQVDGRIAAMEQTRQQAYGELTQQVKGLMSAQETLRSEAGKLVKALRKPDVRGRWGEMQLRRVVEMAGMVDHCDYVEQTTVEDDDKKRLRPDMLVHLPGKKIVVVDAKAPLSAYLDAVECEDEDERQLAMNNHARQIREHIKQLSAKAYWNQFKESPEFVVLFLPGENFFSAALEFDPSLIEQGVENNVILATPTTLISVLRAVAYGWRQEQLAEGALEIAALGKELYARLGVMVNHVSTVGGALGRSVDAYNKAIGSIESRVLVSARKFTELGVTTDKMIADLSPVESVPRSLDVPELNDSELLDNESKSLLESKQLSKPEALKDDNK